MPPSIQTPSPKPVNAFRIHIKNFPSIKEHFILQQESKQISILKHTQVMHTHTVTLGTKFNPSARPPGSAGGTRSKVGPTRCKPQRLLNGLGMLGRLFRLCRDSRGALLRGPPVGKPWQVYATSPNPRVFDV